MSYSTKSSASPVIYMRRNEVIVHQVNGSTLNAYASMSAMTKTWPDTIEHECETYKFVSNEFMPSHAAGNYSGYSQYIKHTLIPDYPGVVLHDSLAAWMAALQIKPEVIHALRLLMLNTHERNASGYAYAKAMCLAQDYGLAGVAMQINYLLLWSSGWTGAQARECKDILRKWANAH